MANAKRHMFVQAIIIGTAFLFVVIVYHLKHIVKPTDFRHNPVPHSAPHAPATILPSVDTSSLLHDVSFETQRTNYWKELSESEVRQLVSLTCRINRPQRCSG